MKLICCSGKRQQEKDEATEKNWKLVGRHAAHNLIVRSFYLVGSPLSPLSISLPNAIIFGGKTTGVNERHIPHCLKLCA